jgi:hypothetical protein
MFEFMMSFSWADLCLKGFRLPYFFQILVLFNSGFWRNSKSIQFFWESDFLWKMHLADAKVDSCQKL